MNWNSHTEQNSQQNILHVRRNEQAKTTLVFVFSAMKMMYDSLIFHILDLKLQIGVFNVNACEKCTN